MNLVQNKWRHGPRRFQLPPLEDFIGVGDGIFPIASTLDSDLGEEIILIIRDQTPFMDDLRKVTPFRFLMKNGCARNAFGPLVFYLFWVENPVQPPEPFVLWDCYFNPKDDDQKRMWRRLANQTHWHVLLIGAGGHQQGFFEFENTFELNSALDFFETACRDVATVDFNRAKDLFTTENSIEDLFQLQ